MSRFSSLTLRGTMVLKSLRYFPTPFLLGFLLSLTSCSEQQRTTDDIFHEEMSLPAVYFTEKTHARVIAPRIEGMFLHQPTGEYAWPAQACHNPACPARGLGGEPHLFVTPYNRLTAPKPAVCPKCLDGRNWHGLNAAQQQQYISWVRPYILPETAARMQVLAAERKRISEQRSSAGR